MVRLVTAPTVHANDKACVWMDAGLLTYKLCDRDFDCEHCPLDAALRCDSRSAGRGDFHRSHAHPCLAARFPDDRLYSPGHTWVQPVDDGGRRVRFGLDEFATSFIDSPRRIRRMSTQDELAQGQAVCVLELDEGGVALGVPIAASIVRWNEGVGADPSAVMVDPYGAGWIVELTPASGEGLGTLLGVSEACRQARFDVRRFRRRVALELLADVDRPDLVPAVGADAGSDLRQILGADRYVALVRELVH